MKNEKGKTQILKLKSTVKSLNKIVLDIPENECIIKHIKNIYDI
jgi:hypothetical protein